MTLELSVENMKPRRADGCVHGSWSEQWLQPMCVQWFLSTRRCSKCITCSNLLTEPPMQLQTPHIGGNSSKRIIKQPAQPTHRHSADWMKQQQPRTGVHALFPLFNNFSKAKRSDRLPGAELYWEAANQQLSSESSHVFSRK